MLLLLLLLLLPRVNRTAKSIHEKASPPQCTLCTDTTTTSITTIATTTPPYANYDAADPVCDAEQDYLVLHVLCPDCPNSG